MMAHSGRSPSGADADNEGKPVHSASTTSARGAYLINQDWLGRNHRLEREFEWEARCSVSWSQFGFWLWHAESKRKRPFGISDPSARSQRMTRNSRTCSRS